jgi:type IV secretory pathway VirB2 component (pilin)
MLDLFNEPMACFRPLLYELGSHLTGPLAYGLEFIGTVVCCRVLFLAKDSFGRTAAITGLTVFVLMFVFQIAML